MKFYSNNYSSCLKMLTSGELNAVLLHGPNYGFAIKIYNEIKTLLSAQTSTLSYKDASSSRLLIEGNNTNFFKTKKIFKIVDVSASIKSELKDTLEKQKFINFFCFISSDNLPASGIRTFFENSKRLASIGCYFEEPLQIRNSILSYFKQNNKLIESEALDLLVSYLTGDYQIMINELQKLLLYTYDQDKITVNEVRMVVCNTDLPNPDNMCYYFAKNEYGKFLEELEKIRNSGVNEVLIIRALIRFFVNLHFVQDQLNTGENLEIIIKKLTPAIFFKFAPKFKELVLSLPAKNIANIIFQLQKAEIEYKLNPSAFDLFMYTMVLEF